jgi:hypothetical protein
VSDSPAQDVSLTHKSNGLAESLQGRKCDALQNKITNPTKYKTTQNKVNVYVYVCAH